MQLYSSDPLKQHCYSLQIDLSGFELAPEDSSGIQLLLHQLFLKIRMDIVDLTKYIIDEQLNVGSVIKVSNCNTSNEEVCI